MSRLAVSGCSAFDSDVKQAGLVLEALTDGVILRINGIESVEVVSGEGVTAKLVPDGIALRCKTRGNVVLRARRLGANVTSEVDLTRLP